MPVTATATNFATDKANRKMQRNDNDILTALAADREQGFRLLLKRFSEPIYWHIRRFVVSHDDAEDAAQECFIRVFRTLDRRREGSLTAWIYRIATNEALRLMERRRTQAPIDTAAVRIAADRYIDYSDLESVKLQQAILALPPKQQLTFNLRYFDALDYDEIARITGSTPQSAKANYHNAKERIVNYMKTNDIAL